jgi:hypothetical protein
VIGVMMLFLLLVLSSRAYEETQLLPPPPSPPLPVPPYPGRQESTVSEEQYAALRGEIDQLASELGQRQRELEELNETMLELQELLALNRDDALSPTSGKGVLWGVDLDKVADVQFIEDEAYRVNKLPRFVEVTAEWLVWHPEEKEYHISELNREGSALQTFLRAAHERRQREYLLFLIRPNGVAAYDAVFAYLVQKYPHATTRGLSEVDIGKEPFTDGWQAFWGRQGRMACCPTTPRPVPARR